jgi:hypothetical protein
MGGMGGAQRPVLRVKDPKMTGVRSARARTRGTNQLVKNMRPKYVCTSTEPFFYNHHQR